ncbi:MAG: type II toxin-antitoxin system RelE/ParE family toxin [PVC group bacterium]
MPPVFLSKRARKFVEKLPGVEKKRCADALRILSNDPLRGEVLLGEFRGLRRYWVGVLRIIYRLEKKPERILIMAIGHRREIYR